MFFMISEVFGLNINSFKSNGIPNALPHAGGGAGVETANTYETINSKTLR